MRWLGGWLADKGFSHYFPPASRMTFAICQNVLVVNQPDERTLAAWQARAQYHGRCHHCLIALGVPTHKVQP